ncbi:MAG: fermentation-respiration switch protein FrsA (DUF1100 family) [Verrucomicrobiales bacterium]|jgi:fermentation-respiration switch protein FrsA (DUF1100 family)
MIGAGLLSSACQNSMVFPSSVAGNRLTEEQASALNPAPIPVAVPGSFGWLFKANASANVTPQALLMFHGNAETVDDYAPWASRIARRGVTVFLVEFPGYREVKGSATQNSIRRVALQGFDWLTTNGFPKDRITVFGRSIGAAVACDLALHRGVNRLALVSPFTTLGEAARNAGFPKAVALGKFNNRKALMPYEGSLLIVHGRSDQLIPYTMGQELIGLSGVPDQNRFFLALDAGHNDLIARHQKILTQRLLRFCVEGR